MPSPFVALVLALCAYRLTRLAGWDDFPLAARIRAWAIGQRWVVDGPIDTIDKLRVLLEQGDLDEEEMNRLGFFRYDDSESVADVLPGKQPPSEVEGVRAAYRRPMLAHLVHCPFCVGFWISAAVWVAWLAWHPTIYGMMPFAISGFVGLVSKNLDA